MVKMLSAVYLACEEPVADDISSGIKWAISRIKELEQKLRQSEMMRIRDAATAVDQEIKIKELEEFLHNIAEPCPYCGDKARAMSMVLDDTEQQI